MFTIISPQDHSFHPDLIPPFLHLILDHPKLSETFQDHQKATFILTQDDTNGIYGGAALLKTSSPIVRNKISDTPTLFSPQSTEIWTCTLCIQIGMNGCPFQYESFCKSFYHHLYEKLVEFGRNEKINFLWMTLIPVEYLSIGFLGFWPYLFQVKPQESKDGLFHGVLSLTGYQPHSKNPHASLQKLSSLTCLNWNH